MSGNMSSPRKPDPAVIKFQVELSEPEEKSAPSKRAKLAEPVLIEMMRSDEFSDEAVLAIIEADLFDVDVRCPVTGDNALQQAIFYEHPILINPLISSTKDINGRNKQGYTTLMGGTNQPDVVRALLNAGADPRPVYEKDVPLTEGGRPEYGRSALWYAMKNRCKESFDRLLEAGLSLDDRYDETHTYRDLWESIQ